MMEDNDDKDYLMVYLWPTDTSSHFFKSISVNISSSDRFYREIGKLLLRFSEDNSDAIFFGRISMFGVIILGHLCIG